MRQLRLSRKKEKTTLVTKRKDPNYAQVSGHIPTDLARRFGIYCAAKQISKSDGLEKAIELLIKQEPEFSLSGQTQPKTIAELVQQNYFALLSDGKIKPENLQALASGNKPSNPDLARIAQILEIPDEQLKKMRDHEFPNQSARKQRNEHH